MHMAQMSDNNFIIRPLKESDMWQILTVNIIILSTIVKLTYKFLQLFRASWCYKFLLFYPTDIQLGWYKRIYIKIYIKMRLHVSV